MKYLFLYLLSIGCAPSNPKDSSAAQPEDDTSFDTEEQSADQTDETGETGDSSDTASADDTSTENDDRFHFPTSSFESTNTAYTSQVPELTLSLNGTALSVAHGIFNADSNHDFASGMSVTLENSIIVVNYGLLDVPFGNDTATWYNLSYDVDLSSLELGTYRFRIVLDYDIADEQGTSVFLEDDIVYE